MPSPTLKTAAEEIKAILKKHDIAGMIALADPDHAEFLYELSPSWSCAKIEGNTVRVKALRADFPSQEAQASCVTNTAGMFMTFLDLASQFQEQMVGMIQMLGQHFEISHRTTHEGLPPEA